MILRSEREKKRYKQKYADKVRSLTIEMTKELENKSDEEAEFIVKKYNEKWKAIAHHANHQQNQVKIPTDWFHRYITELMNTSKNQNTKSL